MSTYLTQINYLHLYSNKVLHFRYKQFRVPLILKTNCFGVNMITEKKKRDKTLYSHPYEYSRDWLWSHVIEDDDIGYPKVYSYIDEEDITYLQTHGKIRPKNITGYLKEFIPPSPEYKCEMDLKECFVAIKEKMTTKSGQLRASMLKLADYEITAWAALLEYLRFSWQCGETKVLLTYKEYYMLFPSIKEKKQTKK